MPTKFLAKTKIKSQFCTAISRHDQQLQGERSAPIHKKQATKSKQKLKFGGDRLIGNARIFPCKQQQ